MKFNLSVKAILSRKMLSVINKVLPKFERVLVVGFPNAEGSAIEVANYISSNYKIKVYYGINVKNQDDPTSLLNPNIKVIINTGSLASKMNFIIKSLFCKYLFLTHSLFLDYYSKRQVVVNIWHGVLYKKIGLLLGGAPKPADITVGTSKLTKKMFSDAFGVPEETVFISGYPRNDILLKSYTNKLCVKRRIDGGVDAYAIVVVWLPTYRQNVYKNVSPDGKEIGNPFYISNFDVDLFNKILKAANAFCFVKPHPLAVKYSDNKILSNVKFIDDKWLTDQSVSLYNLVGCSDILISDVSSVIVDYLLLDQPVICVSEDFDDYRETRGFYFDDIENWLPTQVLKNQTELFERLEQLLTDGLDSDQEKRKKLKKAFFDFDDANSTARLVEHVFAQQVVNKRIK